MSERHLRSVPPTPPSSPLDPPRGRLISAEGIIQRWYTDPVTKKALVNVRWVRDNMPYRQKLSRAKLAWYDADVEAIVDEAARSGVHIKDVKLDYLERKVG